MEGEKMNITGQIKQKFSQTELLEKLITTYGESAKEKEASECIKGGICYMLSVEWLLKLMETPNSYPDSIYNTQFDNEKVLMYYKQIADNYYKFASDFHLTFQKTTEHPGAELLPGNRMVDIDKKFVQLCSNSKYCVKDSYGVYNSPTNLEHVYEKDCALLLYLNVNAGADSFAHEMAIWRYKNKNYFYDPNQGVFLLDDLSKIVGEVIDGHKSNGATAALTITSICEN